jgi:hypothetical protein
VQLVDGDLLSGLYQLWRPHGRPLLARFLWIVHLAAHHDGANVDVVHP